MKDFADRAVFWGTIILAVLVFTRDIVDEVKILCATIYWAAYVIYLAIRTHNNSTGGAT